MSADHLMFAALFLLPWPAIAVAAWMGWRLARRGRLGIKTATFGMVVGVGLALGTAPAAYDYLLDTWPLWSALDILFPAALYVAPPLLLLAPSLAVTVAWARRVGSPQHGLAFIPASVLSAGLVHFAVWLATVPFAPPGAGPSTAELQRYWREQRGHLTSLVDTLRGDPTTMSVSQTGWSGSCPEGMTFNDFVQSGNHRDGWPDGVLIDNLQASLRVASIIEARKAASDEVWLEHWKQRTLKGTASSGLVLAPRGLAAYGSGVVVAPLEDDWWVYVERHPGTGAPLAPSARLSGSCWVMVAR